MLDWHRHIHADAAADVVRGERVTLRDLSRDDVDEMAHWTRFAEPELQWANLELATPRERDTWYERGRTNHSRRRFAILDEGGSVIGTLGLRNIDYRFGEGTLGIIVAADAVGRGYGTDAIVALAHYAFERMGLRKIYLDVAESNVRARRCYDKCGFALIGQHRGPEGNLFIDMVLTRDRFRFGLERPVAGNAAGDKGATTRR